MASRKVSDMDRRYFLTYETKELIKALSEVVVEGLEKEPKKARALVGEFITEFFILSDNIDCIRLMMMNETWYLCLRRVYETTSEKIQIYGFLVEADVAPLSSYMYSIDLTQTDKCCICPKFTCAADLGGYVKLTNLVNERPTDFKSKRWEHKYAARNRPMPDRIADSLLYGYDYVTFPKRKVKITFSNTHPIETAHAIFYADYMEMNIDLALHYMDNIYEVMVRKLVDLMFKKPEEVVKK